MMNAAKGNQCEQADGWFLKEAEWTFEKQTGYTLFRRKAHRKDQKLEDRQGLKNAYDSPSGLYKTSKTLCKEWFNN